MIGHNGGPSVAEGEAWRRHCWQVARADLLPVLPIEVIRTRVQRAQALGLDYRTYASVRAATGHDVVAFLFSSNALRTDAARPGMPSDRAAKLQVVAAERLGLATGRLTPEVLLAANPGALEAAFAAPPHLAPWGRARAELRAILGARPSDRVILVGDLALEAAWAEAAHLARYLPAERYFG